MNQYPLYNLQKNFKTVKETFIVTNIKNIGYLTGFSGSSAFLLITKNKAIFFTDFCYKEQSIEEIDNDKWQIETEKGKRIFVIREWVKKLNIKKIFFETTVSFDFYKELSTLSLITKPVRNIIEDLRKIKTEVEIANIKKAVWRAEKSLLDIKHKIRIGARENEIAFFLEQALKVNGSKKIPFDIIVASGKNSALPHINPTSKRIQRGDFVIVDWGGEANGYFSDITRTFIAEGSNLAKRKEIYSIVNKIRQGAINRINGNIRAFEIDKFTREEIKKFGYGEHFRHSTGHGIGRDIHEKPSISVSNKEFITDGMVFTIEPGIYIPNLGGVRIEDMVIIKNNKPVLLTNLSRQIKIIK